MNNETFREKFLSLVGILFFVCIISCIASTEYSYQTGLKSDEYSTGVNYGYTLHNESVYNECLEYIPDHQMWKLGISPGIIGKEETYYRAVGYVKGYERWLEETEVSEMHSLLEIE